MSRLAENTSSNLQGGALADIEAPAAPSEPEALAGIVEKKGAASMSMGPKWKEHYAEVRRPGILCFFKDATAAAAATNDRNTFFTSDPACQASVDLRLIINFVTPPKKEKKKDDVFQLDLELSDEVVKMRFKSAEERDRWRDLLGDWKDFANDYGDDLRASSTVSPMQKAAAAPSSPSPALAASASSVNRPKSSAAVVNDAVVDLDSINVDDFDEPRSRSEPKAPVVQLSANQPPPSKRAEPAYIPEPAPAAFVEDEKPVKLEGWLEKKGHGKVVSNDWARRYCRIDEASFSFVYYKSNSPKDVPLGSLDLRQVVDITSYDKSGKADLSRFNIDMGDKVYKFKAVNATEGERWMKILNEWKEYFLMHT